jgi:hypothetical protein
VSTSGAARVFGKPTFLPPGDVPFGSRTAPFVANTHTQSVGESRLHLEGDLGRVIHMKVARFCAQAVRIAPNAPDCRDPAHEFSRCPAARCSAVTHLDPTRTLDQEPPAAVSESTTSGRGAKPTDGYFLRRQMARHQIAPGQRRPAWI